MLVQKENVQLDIKDEEKEKYVKMGYKLVKKTKSNNSVLDTKIENDEEDILNPKNDNKDKKDDEKTDDILNPKK